MANDPGVQWLPCDLLTDDVTLPAGEVVILAGNSDPRQRWPWTLALELAVSTARLLPALRNRTVTLLSSVEVYGSAAPPLNEDTPPALPVPVAQLRAWCDDVRLAAREPCPPWRVAALCRRLADADPSGRWVYGMSKLAQELLVHSAVEPAHLTVLRLANTFGLGQERVITRLVRSALTQRPVPVTPAASRSFLPVEEIGRLLLRPLGSGVFNIGGPPIRLSELADVVGAVCGAPVRQQPVSSPASDSCGVVDAGRAEAAGLRLPPLPEALGHLVQRMRSTYVPLFDPPLPVVIMPHPHRPDEVADRQQAAIWSGLVKHGNRWTSELTDRLRVTLDLPRDDELLVTRSGTDALRIAIAGTVGVARPGQLAVLPSFTYRATADVLVQLGYGLQFVDVDPWSWTLDPACVEAACSDERVALVVCVDTFGNPCAYPSLRDVCARCDVPLIADSAAALGSACAGRPLGVQADAHAFSMSFAKTLTSAGAGGAVVFAASARRRNLFAWLGSSLMDELHAVAALDQLALLPELVSRRNQVAQTYTRTAGYLSGFVRPQKVMRGNRHSYVHWVARVPGRADFARRLADLGVQTKPYFPAQHLHHELAPTHLRLPVTDRLDAEALALPMSSELSAAQAENVALAMAEAVRWSEADDKPDTGWIDGPVGDCYDLIDPPLHARGQVLQCADSVARRDG